MQALGYYARGISAADCGRVLIILVRRFRCRVCRKTTSLLPAFAQPYRLVRNRVIDRYFFGERADPEVLRWAILLGRYWRQYEIWLPHLAGIVGDSLGLSPPVSNSIEWWNTINGAWGDVSDTTDHLVSTFQVTIFGRYRCHRPNIG